MEAGTLILVLRILILVIFAGALWWGIGRVVQVRLPLSDPSAPGGSRRSSPWAAACCGRPSSPWPC